MDSNTLSEKTFHLSSASSTGEGLFDKGSLVKEMEREEAGPLILPNTPLFFLFLTLIIFFPESNQPINKSTNQTSTNLIHHFLKKN